MTHFNPHLHGYFVHHQQQEQKPGLIEEDDFDDKDSETPETPAAPVKREKRKYRCRKRSPATIERAKTVRRDKANARERRRMNSLNDALEHLRTILPSSADEPKMTKIETLRKAQEYIANLSFQLSSSSPPSSSSSQPSPSFCESAPCSCCPSLQNTPFQSPCFPPPGNMAQFGYGHMATPMVTPNFNHYTPHFHK